MSGYVQSSHGKAEKQAGEVAQSVILGLSSIFRTYIQKVRCGDPTCNPSAVEVETEGPLETVGYTV